jgi:hypothetical protein
MWRDQDDPSGWNLFWWQEGNASCDCNRAIMFRGVGAKHAVCGDGRFVIEKFEVLPAGQEEWITLPWEEKVAGEA